MSDLYERIYTIVRQIPQGRVTSYGAIARCLGTKSGARMVGWAMNASHVTNVYVPAHRVVNRNGMLSGKHHFGGSTVMEDLLKSEGIEVVDDQIMDFGKHFWDPFVELKIKI